ncbi:hypothetical protein ACQIBV_004399 [Yersinia enterocolitica]|uniref:hypothetical protein n=2 Tax=Yersinia enterocolitica TaxID=630 RepID=UPI0022FDC4EA|nr:hypothetical protein [Yersinia enterocolitica]EKN3500141.1 hypothetical protein [Yersinia enterocolitica]EKN4060879.1 hypothetical protein [Yersinia enterocolitica]MDA5532342.1 hypothetical protein [Yersinia enterocolitica]HDL7130613.1 hypothetical protein [Yersinia enterocolitica]HDL7689050.1 hypothetical protein [Yersinia enterocolitica]
MWVLNALVVVLMAIVTFFGQRMVSQIDTTEKDVNTVKEVQAAQGENIKSLQRDRENTDSEIKRLRDQVDRLIQENAEIKGKLKTSTSVSTNKAASGQPFSF